MRKRAYISRQQKASDFALGLSGWYLFNGLAWILVGSDQWTYGYGIPNLLFLPLNLILLLLFAIYRRWVGLGILSAIALNLVIALVLGVIGNGVCAVPFWLPE